jgi:putative molybdopterin biosynthesis protein
MQIEAYTAEEVAKILRVSRQTVYTLIREGKIPHFKVGNKVRIKRADLNKITNTETQPETTGETK